MKRFKYDPQFLAADGQPFTVLDPGVVVQRKAREEAIEKWDARIEEARVKGLPRPQGEASWQAPTIDCDFAQAMTWFLNHIPFSDEVDGEGKPKPPRKLTPEDAGHAYAAIKAFQNVEDGVVELETAVYDWLLDIVKLDGIEAFRPLATQAIVTERLMDLIKEEKPKKLASK